MPSTPESSPPDKKVLTPPLLKIPDYELLRCIGSGSYGDVWLARNILGKCRAVKIIYRSRFTDPRPFEREFEGMQSFEPISRSHPSQLSILHVGRNEMAGCFYYIMELADSVASIQYPISSDQTSDAPPASGRKLPLSPLNTDLLITEYSPRTLRFDLEQRGRLPIPECVQIGHSLATALSHLHGHSLVHRDIKPSNIIFVNGVAKLGDIGLVTEAGDTQSIVGTEGYLPPEGPGTPQADLFSLGKVLYQISTGLDRRRFADLPDDLRAWPDRAAVVEFNEIVLRACARDLTQRYQTAEQLLADLDALQAGKSIRRARGRQWLGAQVKRVALVAILFILAVALWERFVSRDPSRASRRSRAEPLDPLTIGKNVGGYPPTLMRGTTNIEAWNLYRRGFMEFRRVTPGGEARAMDFLNKAVELDPHFTLAHYQIWMHQFADTWLLTHAKTDEYRRLADKVEKLDPGLAETHVMLGLIRFWKWEWKGAEAEYREALHLNPGCVHASVLFGWMLSHLGRTAESLQVLDAGLGVDPNEPQLVKMKGHAYFVRREFNRALEFYQESMKSEPLFGDGRFRAALAYYALTNYPAAIDAMESRDQALSNDPTKVTRKYAELRLALKNYGMNGYWHKQLAFAQETLSPQEFPYTYAGLYARLGEKKQALDYLEKAYESHDELVYLIMDEFWDPWRDEDRFEVVRKKAGLPRHPNFPAPSDVPASPPR